MFYGCVTWKGREREREGGEEEEWRERDGEKIRRISYMEERLKAGVIYDKEEMTM